jgi:prevent-host-death family protein
MVTISTYDAKATLSALLQQVEQGEEVVITRHGTPVARLVRYEKPAWKPFSGPLPEELRIRHLPPGEDVAPVFPEGIPWSPTDPV